MDSSVNRLNWSRRRLWLDGPLVGPLGFGAFKIGRNEQIKYARAYALPDDAATAVLLNHVLDLGVDLIDTAPAYGLSEARIGRHLASRRKEFVLVTKVGERFDDGVSTYAYDERSLRASIERSVAALGGAPDLLLLHSDGRDVEILRSTPAIRVMERARDDGLVGAIGMSPRTVEGATAALAWAQAVMVEYSLEQTEAEPVIAAAHDRGIGVLVKKGLASGHLAAEAAIPFVLAQPGVDALVVGGLDLGHLERNAELAAGCRPR